MASLLSSYFAQALDERTVFLGEVGLTGEVRSIPMMEIRLKEIAQMNYKRVITSKRAAQDFRDKFKLEILGVSKANELKNLLFKTDKA